MKQCFGDEPLSSRMRPRCLKDYLGQDHLVGKGAPLRVMLDKGKVPSSILYGPPGTGKTTLARLMADSTGRNFLHLNAVSSGMAETRSLISNAMELKKISGMAHVVFIDEIYHFNKTQQNILLPNVERGDILLIGTTTENPFFEINKTLLSRMTVWKLNPICNYAASIMIERAITDVDRGLGELNLTIESDAVEMLARIANGDGRYLLNSLEGAALIACADGRNNINTLDIKASVGETHVRYDRNSDRHYDIISAFIKSVRGSDVNAALHWLAGMLTGGEDIAFIARRLMILASEDIGLADPMALLVASSCADACATTGMPEARIALAEATIYLASAPKSNSACIAIGAAIEDWNDGGGQNVPLHLKSHGTGYKYPHDFPGHFVEQVYLDKTKVYYEPGNSGFERKIIERLQKLSFHKEE